MNDDSVSSADVLVLASKLQQA